MGKLIFEEETGAILGACHDVYMHMGCGFLEAVYQECLTIEFSRRGIPFTAQAEMALHYKERKLQQVYRPDFLCFESVVVELKAASDIAGEHLAQVMNYLHGTRRRVGLLVNFGHHPGLQFKRLVL